MSDVRVPDINKLIIAGRVGKELELKHTTSGKAFCNFSICNTKYSKNFNGERADENLWLNVTCWEKTAEFAAQNLHKGSPVQIEGRLKEESWTDTQTGQERKMMKLIAERMWPLAWDNAEGDSNKPASATPAQNDDNDDGELPF